MEEYLSKLNLNEDENSLRSIVEQMKLNYISDVDIHTENGGTVIYYRSSRMKNSIIIRLKELKYSFVVLFFNPYKQIYPNINISHN